jgi:hypothetical protein
VLIGLGVCLNSEDAGARWIMSMATMMVIGKADARRLGGACCGAKAC